MKISLILTLSLLLACGEDALHLEQTQTDDSVGARIAIEGNVIHMDGPASGAFVHALDAAGHRTGRAVTDANGDFTLGLPDMPAALEIKAYHRTPRFILAGQLQSSGTDRFRLDAHMGPVLGADSTAESLSFMVLETANGPKVVPQMAWGIGGALGSEFDGVVHLLLGARDHRLSSLLPVGVAVENLESAVIEHADHLEVRLSEDLNAYNLGSEYFAAMVDQIVASVSHNFYRRELPVRIRVACATCPDGFEPLRDGVLGPTGPSDSYYPQVAHPDAAFTDTANHRFAGHMAMAKALGIATGYWDGANRPNNTVTRAELAAMLVSALGLTRLNPSTPKFWDVSPTYWAYRSIETAAARGFIAGGADGRFRPTDPVTRAELASYITNAARWPQVVPAWSSFPDVAPTYWAYRRIELAFGWCHSVEPRNWQDGRFEPAAHATRAETIVGVVRMMGCLVGSEARN